MAAAVERYADLIFVTSDNPRSEEPEAIIADILPGFTQAKPMTEPDRRKAIAMALRMRSEKDVVLIAGKGHEPYQEIKGIRYPYSDAEEVKAFYA
jgi:UDP-N-acetylmuramoyl-L-alanyl-D-glutamate--2,6-diaminopimelate ligase